MAYDKTKGRLAQLLNKKLEGQGQKPEEDIQVACFHPTFAWASAEEDTLTANNDYIDALDFEKRSPFPTINLLRSATIKQLASQVKY